MNEIAEHFEEQRLAHALSDDVLTIPEMEETDYREALLHVMICQAAILNVGE